MIKQGVFNFTEVFERTDRETSYYYDDGFFRSPSSVPDPRLRTMSLNMSMAFFPSARRGSDYKKCLMNARALLSETGFDHIKVNSDYEREPDTDSLGIGAAHKYIDTEGGRTSLILICFRGASYGDEWASNIILGTDGPAEGFAKGRDVTLEFIRNYLRENEAILTDNIKYWISGYSRVAAIAGLVGAAIRDDAVSFRTKEDDIYTYTFESPLYSDYRARNDYTCIHNTVNPFDMVPMIPPKEWGFSRYGQDDCVLPSGSSDLYRENVDEMKRRLAVLNPDIPYAADSFRPMFQYGGQICPMSEHADLKGKARPEEWWFGRLQDEYLEHFIHFMSLHIVKGSDLKKTAPHERRRQFCEYSQGAFSEGARVYMGTSFERREGMRGNLHAVVEQDMSFRQQAWVYFLLYCNNKPAYRMVKRYLSRMLEKRVAALPDPELDIEELRAFGRIIDPMTDYFIRSASRDVRRYRFAYISSLIENLDRITAAHCPEVTLAWLQTLYDT